ncbi:hypothetical protein [Olivibacter sitiensis]|uniref:hypothetical protein n=1 Tax=Olivibacter sitiensis TaxID=376470 RepID=UPI00041B9D0D|nr:hypothetical protein [Olivibacter sitiensis]
MKGILADFQPDFSYYEYPGGSHWYSNESVDWKPLFDYFRWHLRKIDTAVNNIDFITANPGISASYYWTTIYQQQQPLEYSRVVLTRDLLSGIIEGNTENVGVLQLVLKDFQIGQSIQIKVDSLQPLTHIVRSLNESLFIQKNENAWRVIPRPSLQEKGPHRNGTFKEAFNHRMVYVYGTKGNAEENKWALEKARYDAESWYYRGNGAFDIISDDDFEPSVYAERNVILIGNAKTNSAWSTLLADCPITVDPSGVSMGNKRYEGEDLGGYFVWKKPGSDIHSVGVITGTGVNGMRAATANQYFAGASGFPDYMFFRLGMLKNGPQELTDAGFYSNLWELAQPK